MSTPSRLPSEALPSAQPALAAPPRPAINEDWLALCIGLSVFLLSLGLVFGADILGWVVTTPVWTNPAKALAPGVVLLAVLVFLSRAFV